MFESHYILVTFVQRCVCQNGADPVIKDDGEYPAWLWTMELPITSELETKGIANLSPAEARRFYQLQSTATIKNNNLTA